MRPRATLVLLCLLFWATLFTVVKLCSRSPNTEQDPNVYTHRHTKGTWQGVIYQRDVAERGKIRVFHIYPDSAKLKENPCDKYRKTTPNAK